MEGVRWTNEDDDEEEEFIESEEQKESIWEAPEESEEESSWFDSQESESRAEDFLSIVRGEKADEEEESAGDSFMGKLIGEKPEEILEEDDAEAEEQPEQTSETPVEEPAELSTELDQTENQELETEQVIEQEPEQEQEMEPEAEERPEQTEEEPLVEEEEPADEAAPEEEPQEEIGSLDDYDSEPDSTNEQEDSVSSVDAEEPAELSTELDQAENQELETEQVIEQEPEVEMELEPEEPLEAEETVPAEAEVPIEVDEQVEDGGDDGGEEPPEDDHSRQASNNQELTSNDSSGRNSESVNVTHEHSAAGAGLVGVLLGLEHFGRKRADRKLKKQIESNKKEANETDEEFATRMKMIEEEQRIQAQEQDRIDKNQIQADTLRDRNATEDEQKEVVIQSVTGENFTSENIDKAEEGRERKAGLKLETDIEQSVEEAKMINQELGGEIGLDSRHESASQRDDGSGLDSDSTTSGPTHISEVISSSGINNPVEKDAIINEIIHSPESASEKDAYAHESYMSSVQAGVAIGVIIIIITAVIFILR